MSAVARDQSAGGSTLARSLACVGVVTLVHVGVLSRLRVFDVRPDSLLLSAIVVGLLAGSELGAVTGFAAGLAFDLFVGTPFGLSALVDGLAGYAVGFAHDRVLPAARDFPLTLVAGTSIAAQVGFAAGLAVFAPALVPTPLRLLRIAVLVTLWNLLLAAPMRWFTRRLLGVPVGG